MLTSRGFGCLISFALATLVIMYVLSNRTYIHLAFKLPGEKFPVQQPVNDGGGQVGNIQWVVGRGDNLLERVVDYQEALTRARNDLDMFKGTTNLDAVQWKPISEPQLRVDGREGDTLYQLQNDKSVVTVALAWIDGENMVHSFMDPRNLILREYYKWAESENLCLFMKYTKYKHSQRSVCPPNETVPLETEPIQQKFLNLFNVRRNDLFPGGYTGIFHPHVDVGPVPHIFYIHLVQNVIVDQLGDVFSENIKIVPLTCRSNRPAKFPKGIEKSPLYNEVFVITQFWGSGFFHFNCESAPRVAPYVDFLRSHGDIRIHVLKGGGFVAKAVELLGLDPSRLVTGTIRAKLVYLPQSTRCGNANVHLVQLLSHRYRQAIRQKFPPSSLQRNSIVVVRRSGGRKFKHAPGIESMVQSMAEENGFRYELFKDNPLPSYDEAVQIFNRAVIVVGPHGAGLSNLLFSEPGTVMIEGVCNAPKTNLCYQVLGYVLGHKYHGLGAGPGCEGVVNVGIDTIAQTLKLYIERLKQERRRQNVL